LGTNSRAKNAAHCSLAFMLNALCLFALPFCDHIYNCLEEVGQVTSDIDFHSPNLQN
jgi:hypothetical protein